MKIQIDREGTAPVYLQISSQIRDMILSGRLPSGSKLPPERKLADTLGVNRSTVLNAYRELKSKGYADSCVGSGTVVANGMYGPETVTDGFKPLPMPWDQLFSESVSRTSDTTVKDLLKQAAHRDMILFAAGVSAQGLDSLDELLRVQQEVVREYGHRVVSHMPTEGYSPLRESICELMTARGINAGPSEVMVLSGSQQGIDLAARIFLDPGDVVFVEEPTFFSAFQIFRTAGARVIGVPTDGDGMRTDLLASMIERFKPKLIYTIPDFQNPSGTVMSLERRRQLLPLAYRHQVAILEDDPYGRLRYEGEDIPPLKTLDTHGYVIYLSTFSKLLFPGFRVGWLTAPAAVLDRFTLLKQNADLHTCSLTQLVFHRFIREGLLEGQIRRVASENALRRDIMLDELEKTAVRGMHWARPEGGLYLWCRLPDGISQQKLLAKASEYGVAFVPGGVFYPNRPSGSYIRLNYTYPSPELIREGVRRLTKAVRHVSSEYRGGTDETDLDLRSLV